MAVKREELEKIMKLSRLSFEEEEYATLEEEFNKIIAFADQINQAVYDSSEERGTKGNTPVSYEKLRQDKICESLSNEKILSNVEGMEGLFVVKKSGNERIRG